MNLVTDSLQRTCTGTIIIELDGTGWETDGGKNGNTTNPNKGPDREGGTPTVGPQFTTVTGEVSRGATRQVPEDPNEVDVPLYGDNVHFGPAGIGLLIMGFLVLGCKYSSISFDMRLPKDTAKEIKPFRCST